MKTDLKNIAFTDREAVTAILNQQARILAVLQTILDLESFQTNLSNPVYARLAQSQIPPTLRIFEPECRFQMNLENEMEKIMIDLQPSTTEIIQ